MASNYYIGGNEVTEAGCSEKTCGENILIEAPGSLFTGNPTAIDGLNLRFDQANWQPDAFDWDDPAVFEPADKRHPSMLVIQSGTGAGQYRRITKTTRNVLTIEYPWDVAPDKESTFTVITTSFRNAIVDNTIKGWPQALENKHTTNVGIQSYGSLLDSVIRGNTVSSLSRGIEISSLINSSCGQYVSGQAMGAAGNNCPTWNNLIENNTVTDTLWGIASWTRVEDPPRDLAGPAMLGNIVRDNSVDRSTYAGITVGDINKYHKPDSWQFNTVVEMNKIQKTPLHVELMGLQSEPLIRANILADSGPEAVGVRIEKYVTDPYICQNTFAGSFAARISLAGRTSDGSSEMACTPANGEAAAAGRRNH
jgi:hypothetical protein